MEKFISEADPKLELSPASFSEEVDSTILVRECVCGSKLEGAYKKKKGPIIDETSHTISILPKKGKEVTVIYSKKHVALENPKMTKTPQSDKKPKQVKAEIRKQATIVQYSSNSEDLGYQDAAGGWMTERLGRQNSQRKYLAN